MRFTDSQRYYWALPVYEYLQDGVAILLEKQNLLRVLRDFRSLLPLPPRLALFSAMMIDSVDQSKGVIRLFQESGSLLIFRFNQVYRSFPIDDAHHEFEEERYGRHRQ